MHDVRGFYEVLVVLHGQDQSESNIYILVILQEFSFCFLFKTCFDIGKKYLHRPICLQQSIDHPRECVL